MGSTSTYLSRDRKIAAFFRPLRNELDKLPGDVSRLSLHSVLATGLEEHRTKHGNTVQTVGELTVTIRIDANTLVRLDMDDAAKIGDDWYFLDNPRTRIKVVKIRQGKEVESKTIRLDIEAAGGPANRRSGNQGDDQDNQGRARIRD